MHIKILKHEVHAMNNTKPHRALKFKSNNFEIERKMHAGPYTTGCGVFFLSVYFTEFQFYTKVEKLPECLSFLFKTGVVKALVWNSQHNGKLNNNPKR